MPQRKESQTGRWIFLTVGLICATFTVNFIIINLNANHFDWVFNGEMGSWLGNSGITATVLVVYHWYITKFQKDTVEKDKQLSDLQDLVKLLRGNNDEGDHNA